MKLPNEYFAEMEAKIPKGTFRTRFAPSPTGFMHLGGLRTALYAYLLAKKQNGVLILRIEDTDQERRVEGATELIIETLTACGINYDEGPDIGGPAAPYTQSERREIYSAYAQLLIESGHAYRCFCDKATLDEQRLISDASRVAHKYDRRCIRLSAEETAAKLNTPHVIRQKVNQDGKVFFNDAVYGRIEVDNSTIEDQVILKSDGLPTYNFANVVDDHLMGVTHVIRGNEFLSSTPKHVLLYHGFGWETPEYIHVPQIMRDSQKKLSKRDGDAYYSDFIEKGYLKEAIINYITLLGWSPGGENEKFSLVELGEIFDVAGISKSPAIFDFAKLKWFNKEYISAMDDEDFYNAALPLIKKSVKTEIDKAYILGVLKSHCELLPEVAQQLDFVDEMPPYTTDLFNNEKKKISTEGVKTVLPQVKNLLSETDAWEKETIRQQLLALVKQLGLKNGQVLEPLRAALSGKASTSGGSMDICVLLGKDECITRLKKAVNFLGETL
jgi:glutamyl-tRNA synthetase